MAPLPAASRLCFLTIIFAGPLKSLAHRDTSPKVLSVQSTGVLLEPSPPPDTLEDAGNSPPPPSGQGKEWFERSKKAEEDGNPAEDDGRDGTGSWKDRFKSHPGKKLQKTEDPHDKLVEMSKKAGLTIGEFKQSTDHIHDTLHKLDLTGLLTSTKDIASGSIPALYNQVDLYGKDLDRLPAVTKAVAARTKDYHLVAQAKIDKLLEASKTEAQEKAVQDYYTKAGEDADGKPIPPDAWTNSGSSGS